MFCKNQVHCTEKNENFELLFETEIYQTTYEYRKCKKCGIIFHYPEPTDEVLKEHYTNYGSRTDANLFKKNITIQKKKYVNKSYIIKKYLKQSTNYDDNRKPKLLDVGCSNGIGLYHFKNTGFDVYGVEIDPLSALLAKELISEEKVFTGVLSDSPFLNQSFDVVVCEQTIEHVPNPLEVITQINQTLKNNGILYITTPNFNGPSFNVLKDRWKNVQPHDHISMFTPEVLTNILNTCGFKVIFRQIAGLTYNKQRSEKGSYLKYKDQHLLTFFKYVGNLLSLSNSGDSMTYIALKVDKDSSL